MKPRKSNIPPQGSSRAASSATAAKSHGENGRPSHQDITQRAYEIYKARGTAGDALTDWLQAERELGKQG